MKTIFYICAAAVTVVFVIQMATGERIGWAGCAWPAIAAIWASRAR